MPAMLCIFYCENLNGLVRFSYLGALLMTHLVEIRSEIDRRRYKTAWCDSICGNYSQEPYQHAYGYYSERIATHTELPENQCLWDVPDYPSVGHILQRSAYNSVIEQSIVMNGHDCNVSTNDAVGFTIIMWQCYEIWLVLPTFWQLSGSNSLNLHKLPGQFSCIQPGNETMGKHVNSLEA